MSGLSRLRNHAENQRPNRTHFAESARKPRRKRAENAKTIRKTARRTVKPLNKSPNFRMFDTYATPFLLDWPSCTPAWHYPGGNPHLVRKPRHCSRNHPRRPLASARCGSGAPQTRGPAADSAPLARIGGRVGDQALTKSSTKFPPVLTHHVAGGLHGHSGKSGARAERTPTRIASDNSP